MLNNRNLQAITKKPVNNNLQKTVQPLQRENRVQDCTNVYFKQNEQMYKDPVTVCQAIPESPRILFDKLLLLAAHHRFIYVSQETMGLWVGVTARQARRILKELEDAGFLASVYRPFNTKLYYINPFFFKIGIRKLLNKIFISCRYAPLLFQLVNAQIHQMVIKKTFQSENVLQEKNIVIFNKPRLYTTGSVGISSYVENSDSGPDPGHGIKKSVQREKSAQFADRRVLPMNVNPIREDIRALKELRLTKWGQIKLMAFDATVIRYAYERLKTTKGSINDPFSWFVSICIRRTDELLLKPHWVQMRFLQQTYKQPHNAPMTLPPIPNPTPTALKLRSPGPKPVTPLQKLPHEDRTNFDRQGEFNKFQEQLAQNPELQKLFQIAWGKPFSPTNVNAVANSVIKIAQSDTTFD